MVNLEPSATSTTKVVDLIYFANLVDPADHVSPISLTDQAYRADLVVLSSQDKCKIKKTLEADLQTRN